MWDLWRWTNHQQWWWYGDIPATVSSNMAIWEIPERTRRFLAGKISELFGIFSCQPRQMTPEGMVEVSKQIKVQTFLVGGLEHVFSHRVGISSSQLANSYFSEGWRKTTKQILNLKGEDSHWNLWVNSRWISDPGDASHTRKAGWSGSRRKSPRLNGWF